MLLIICLCLLVNLWTPVQCQDMENWKKMDDVGDKHCIPVVKHGPVLSRKACFDICGDLTYCMYERVSGAYCLASNTCDEWETIPSNKVDRYDIWKKLVHGGYSEWSSYTKCSTSCGEGQQTRTRACTNPSPGEGGKDCLGSPDETHSCNVASCPVNGGYSEWGNFSQCSTTCGDGNMRRERTCTNPEPQFKGEDCSGLGEAVKSETCNIKPCPIHGGYGVWTTFSKCSLSCGGGSQNRTRQCNKPSPEFGGKDCSSLGNASESQLCNKKPCPINGGYGEWTEFTGCSRTCGSGYKNRTRKCNNPTPAHGGKDCSSLGKSEELPICILKSCPIDGGYSEWVPFTTCTVSCGTGVKSRFRSCDNPTPKHGGSECSSLGKDNESLPCNQTPCPVDGGYSEWRAITNCSKTCGPGYKQMRRSCSKPVPKHRGKNCSSLGVEVKSEECFIKPCPIDGGYSEWTPFGDCSSSCGGGQKTRERTCNNPSPQHGGKDCSSIGKSTESNECNTKACPIDGGYGAWSKFKACSLSCGGGNKNRTRKCNEPAPEHGGEDCSLLGLAVESVVCNDQPCPIDGGYSEWSKFTACSLRCAGGNKTRHRACNNPTPQHKGKDCSALGKATETVECNTHVCPIDGGYTSWTNFTTCSQPCGRGSATRTRTCTKPVPQHGGMNCSGVAEETEKCNSQPCKNKLLLVAIGVPVIIIILILIVIIIKFHRAREVPVVETEEEMETLKPTAEFNMVTNV